MSLWLAKWPNGDIVVARADGEQEMMELLDEAADPGLACIEEYDGPFCLEFKAKLPGCSLRDEQRYLCPSRAAAEATQQDAVRCELWAAQQAGGTEGGEVQVAAADGSTARAHAAVLRAGGAALKELVGSPAQPQITLPCVPSAAVLHTLLEWLYVSKASFKDTSAEEVLPAAAALGLEGLAEECDHSLSYRVYEIDYPFLTAQGMQNQLASLCELLELAHRHGRTRLAKYALFRLPPGKWRVLHGLPAYPALPEALQQALRRVAHRNPPFVRRAGRCISSQAYAEAGGQLDPDEAAELADYQAAQGAAPDAAQQAQQQQQQQQQGGRRRRTRSAAAAAAVPAAPAPVTAGAAAAAAGLEVAAYEVSPEEAAKSDLFAGDYGGWLQYDLNNGGGSYDGRVQFFEAVTDFSYPNVAAELKERSKQSLLMGEQQAAPAPGQLSAADQRLVAAILRDQQGGSGEEEQAQQRTAELAVAAERGDPTAGMMLFADMSVPLYGMGAGVGGRGGR